MTLIRWKKGRAFNIYEMPCFRKATFFQQVDEIFYAHSQAYQFALRKGFSISMIFSEIILFTRLCVLHMFISYLKSILVLKGVKTIRRRGTKENFRFNKAIPSFLSYTEYYLPPDIKIYTVFDDMMTYQPRCLSDNVNPYYLKNQ